MNTGSKRTVSHQCDVATRKRAVSMSRTRGCVHIQKDGDGWRVPFYARHIAFTSGQYIQQDTDKLEVVQKIPREHRGAWSPAT